MSGYTGSIVHLGTQGLVGSVQYAAIETDTGHSLTVSQTEVAVKQIQLF